MCQKISRQLQNKIPFLSRSIFLHGLPTIDFSKEFSIYRSISMVCWSKDLSYGNSKKSLSMHIGRCQQEKRLVSLCRFCSSIDIYSQNILYKRRILNRTGPICVRFFNYRPFPLVSAAIYHKSLTGGI